MNTPLIGSVTFGPAADKPKDDDRLSLQELTHAKFELYRALERIRLLEEAGSKMLEVLVQVDSVVAYFSDEIDKATEAWHKAMGE